jgi:hypothetical protein
MVSFQDASIFFRLFGGVSPFVDETAEGDPPAAEMLLLSVHQGGHHGRKPVQVQEPGGIRMIVAGSAE